MAIEDGSEWRAWHTFLSSLGSASLVLIATVLAGLIVWFDQGALVPAQMQVLTGIIYWGVGPLVLVGLGALGVHLVRPDGEGRAS